MHLLDTLLQQDSSAPPLVEALRNVILPKPVFLLAFHVLAVAVPLYFWGGWCLSPEGDPFDVQVFYRPLAMGGDSQYFPLVTGLAGGNLGDSSACQDRGSGLVSVPLGGVWVHALLLRLLGNGGFIVADVVLLLSWYLGLATLFRMLGIQTILCLATGALITSGAVVLPREFVPFLGPINTIVALDPLRLPRPLGSEVYRLAAVCLLLEYIRFRSTAYLHFSWYVAFGAVCGVLVQSEPFASISIALAASGCMLLRLSTNYKQRISILVRSILLAFVAVGLLSPLIAQRVLEHPDVPIRLGLFPVDPLDPLFIGSATVLKDIVYTLVVTLVAGSIAWAARARKGWNGPQPQLLLLSMILVLAWLALPFTCFIMGNVSQIYHFPCVVYDMSGYLLLSAYLLLIQNGLIWMARTWRGAAFLCGQALAGIAVILTLLTGYWLLERVPWNSQYHSRPDFKAYWRLGADYRRDFRELTHSLRKPIFDGCSLGTFDFQVFSHWTAFRGGCSVLRDAALSPASDEEIELGLVGFAELLGLSEDKFAELIAKPYVNIFWLSHNKYQFSPAHTFSGIEDYPESARQSLRHISKFNSWSVFVPNSEKARLMAAYRYYRSQNGRALVKPPKIIVLTKSDLELGARPDESLYQLVKKNRTFELWQINRDFSADNHTRPCSSVQPSGMVKRIDHNAGKSNIRKW